MNKFLLTFKLCIFVIFQIKILLAQDVESLIGKGDQCYKQFDNFQALVEYEKAYQLHPYSYETLMKLTRAYIDTGEDLNPDESETYFTKAIEYSEMLLKQYPDSAQAYYLLAAVYGNMVLLTGGKEKVKLARLTELNARIAAELNPNLYYAHILLGICYREVANINWLLKSIVKLLFGGFPDLTNEDAEKMFLKAKNINPQNLVSYFELAITYEQMDLKEKAISCYKKVLQLPECDHQDFKKKEYARQKLEKLQN